MMFINSIFLPKNISDQTLPEGIAGKIGNFSHLFSNVFRIVKDEQEGTVPFQLANLSPEASSDTQNELLKVSLLSDKKLTLENKNISMIVAAFLSKLNPGEFTEELADANKVKVNEKVPKYFSLNKNEFIKEIKNVIDSLKNSDTKSLENIEISLIANGQSIKINPLTTNIVDLENWVTEQLQSNTDFEILVKSGQKKLAVDVEPVKHEVSKTEKPVEIISTSDQEVNETEINPTLIKSVVSSTSFSKNIASEGSVFEHQLKGLRQTYVNTNGQIVKQEAPTIQSGISSTQYINSESIDISKEPHLKVLTKEMRVGAELQSDINSSIKSELNEILKSNYSSNGKIETPNTSIPQSDLKSKSVSDNQSELVAKSETFTKKENVLSDSNLTLKKISSEKFIDTTISSLNNEVKVQPKSLQAAENAKNPETVKQTSEVDVKERTQSDNKISVKSNQKINSVFVEKNSVQEKIVLTDLIEKAEVKDIKINVQNTSKTVHINSPKIQDVYQPELSSAKENVTKIHAPELNVDIKKVLSVGPEFKQSSIENTSNKAVDAVKAQSNPKLRIQQELFVESEFVENEEPVLIKNESIKTTNSNQQTLKENIVTGSSEKINIDKSNLEQIKNLPNDSYKAKPEVIVNPLAKKIISTEIKILEKTVEQNNFPLKVVAETQKANITDPAKAINQVNILSKSVSKLADQNLIDILSEKTVKKVVNENTKETATLRANLNLINKSAEKIVVSSTNTPEKNTSNLKAKAIVENLRTSLKEFASDDVKQERVLNNKFENKNVKVDFIQRRAYSQIPHLEVMTAETEVKNVKNSALNLEINKNEITQSVDEPVKSTQNKIEQNTKNDKQVWVKVSLEKNDSETVSEARKSPNQQNRITIDTNSDGMKKDFDQNNFSEKESHESPKQKPQVVQVEASQNTEMKTVNQNTSTQQDFTAGLKTEIKTESNPFKSAFNTEETKAGSRAAEMIEKVKVISSGEMIREISKVLETGEKQSIVLRLVPKELGSVKIILDTIDNVLTAKVEVENETVGHIVRNNVEQLKHNLMQSGVNVNSINISYHNSDQKQQGFNNQKRKNSGSLPENDIEEVDESIVSKKMGYNTYEYLA